MQIRILSQNSILWHSVAWFVCQRSLSCNSHDEGLSDTTRESVTESFYHCSWSDDQWCWLILPTPFRNVGLVLSASVANQTNMGNDAHELWHDRNKTKPNKTVCIFHGISCINALWCYHILYSACLMQLAHRVTDSCSNLDVSLLHCQLISSGWSLWARFTKHRNAKYMLETRSQVRKFLLNGMDFNMDC